MLESQIQNRFIAAAEKMGLQAWPVAFRGRRGMADVLVMNTHRYHCLVELKKESKAPRPLQSYYHRKLSRCIDVFTAAGLTEALALLPIIEERRNEC